MQEWLKLGQRLKPLFSMIDFDRIVIDMLHLLLRIGEKLLTLLIKDILKHKDWEKRFAGKLIQNNKSRNEKQHNTKQNKTKKKTKL